MLLDNEYPEKGKEKHGQTKITSLEKESRHMTRVRVFNQGQLILTVYDSG